MNKKEKIQKIKRDIKKINNLYEFNDKEGMKDNNVDDFLGFMDFLNIEGLIKNNIGNKDFYEVWDNGYDLSIYTDDEIEYNFDEFEMETLKAYIDIIKINKDIINDNEKYLKEDNNTKKDIQEFKKTIKLSKFIIETLTEFYKLNINDNFILGPNSYQYNYGYGWWKNE